MDKSIIYIGSTNNIAKRINEHRRSANKGEICYDFYICVREHGWYNLRLGILEYINLDELKMDECEIKRAIFDREQYYLNMMNPTLNKLKIAGSSLGYKHTKETRRIMSLKRRGKNGIKVKVFDDNNNIVNIFPTIASAAKHYALSSSTLSKYIKLGYSIDNLRFEGEVKDVRVWVYDKKYSIIDVFSTANKADEFCGIYHTVLYRYLKSGKLFNNKYYFKRTNSPV